MTVFTTIKTQKPVTYGYGARVNVSAAIIFSTTAIGPAYQSKSS